MAAEKFIKPREPYHGNHHEGRRSHVRRIAEAVNSVREYVLFEAPRKERIAAHEGGHTVGDQYMPEGFEQELELFWERKNPCD